MKAKRPEPIIGNYKMGRFAGDGRTTLYPLSDPRVPGTCRPIHVTRGRARQLLKAWVIGAAFDKPSTHSAMGGLVWVMSEFCTLNNIPYAIKVHYNDPPVGEVAMIIGYTVERTSHG